MTRVLHQYVVSPLIDLSYVLMSFLFSQRSPRWYARLNAWHYRRQAQLYDKHVIEWEGARYAQALEAGLKAILVTPHTILDVNTGTGFVLQFLIKLFPEAQIVATDLSHAMLEQARIKYPQITFVQADTAQLPFEKESFDLVTLHNGPPHIAEMARVTRSGGQLLIAFTAGARLPSWLKRRWLREAERFGHIQIGHQGDGLWVVLTKRC